MATWATEVLRPELINRAENTGIVMIEFENGRMGEGDILSACVFWVININFCDPTARMEVHQIVRFANMG